MTLKEMAKQTQEAHEILIAKSAGFHDRQFAYCTLASNAVPLARAYLELEAGMTRPTYPDCELTFEYRDSDKRIYVYDLDGKFLWSGTPTFNAAKCAEMDKRIKDLEAERDKAIEHFNLAPVEPKTATEVLLAKKLWALEADLDRIEKAAREAVVAFNTADYAERQCAINRLRDALSGGKVEP